MEDNWTQINVRKSTLEKVRCLARYFRKSMGAIVDELADIQIKALADLFGDSEEDETNLQEV